MSSTQLPLEPQPASPSSLRSRLLFALTAGTALGLSACVCGDYEPTITETTPEVISWLADEGATCPEDPSSTEVDWAEPPPGCEAADSGNDGDLEDARLVGQDETECRYELQCVSVTECIGGRPIEQGGCAVLAPSMSRADWRSGKQPELDQLSSEERERLAALWTQAGLEEHSSVAGFNKLALDLMALGAPPQLLMAAQQAAIEEIRHAQDAFALASAYAGRPVGPGALPLQPIQPARDLVELALSTAREGCIKETLSAWDAQRRLEQEKDPAVRAALQAVVEEETRHAELAWQILGWAVSVGGEPVRAALAQLFTSLFREGGVHPRLQPCIEEVLRPVAGQLLAA